MMSRERSKRRRSSGGPWLLTKFIVGRLLRWSGFRKLARPGSTLPVDDEGRNHPAARRDVRQLRRGQAREGRADPPVEEQRVEVYELFGVDDRAVVQERRERLARRRDALLHEVVAVGERRLQRLLPG